MEEWFRRVVLDAEPGPGPALARMILRVVAILYSSVIEAYKLLFNVGILRTVRLPCRVISVGNISMGGVGKTVAVQALARSLQSAGIRCVVLSYGFRASSRHSYCVVSDANSVRLTADEAGDEAVMLARSLPGIPVMTGPRRAVSGAAATKLFNPDIIILDDGFQHWRLHRDEDIVLLDARRPLSNGRTFPAGMLRERPAAIRRATAVILTRCDIATPEELRSALEITADLAPGQPCYQARHEIGKPYPASRPECASTLDAGSPVWLVSGIGQNDTFEASVRRMGWQVGGASRFADHHHYAPADVVDVIRQASGCDAVFTTEKDAVKLAPLWPPSPALYCVPVTLSGIEQADWLRLAGVSQSK